MALVIVHRVDTDTPGRGVNRFQAGQLLQLLFVPSKGHFIMTVIETIASWCAQPKTFTPQARNLALEAITDTLACLYAGRNDFSTRAVSDAWAPPRHSGLD